MLYALIVDDDPVNKRFLLEALEDYAECVTAADGKAGVRAFRAAVHDGRPFDFILMDVMMPGMDGLQALEKIRDIEESRGTLPESATKVIMISALDDVRSMSRAFFQGHALSYLPKPFTGDTLLSELRKFGLID